MRPAELSRTIQVPDDVEVTLDGREVTVKGPKGILKRNFPQAKIKMELENKTLRVWAEWPRKKEAALVGTVCSHIQNMIKGVQKGFTYKLKIVFSHFPITVEVKDRTVLIKNFTGERSPRKAKIIGNANVKVLAEDVLVQDINIEDVSQTAANIEQATKVKRKDPRIFLDGIYVYERSEGMEK
ncbi:MAG: 50S ribosomal protein L6 [Candidatus Bathyarchaeia archaeon]